jgi:hypothetical protein
MDLFFNVDGVGTETGLAETAGCVVSVKDEVLVAGAEAVVVVAVVVAVVEARSIY